MNVYLAGFKTIEKHWNKPTDDIYLLSSFYEHRTGRYGDYVTQDRHILDSGAFSFFGGGKTVDWTDYTNKYCDFINKTKQRLFFELDIDTVTSLEHAEDLRKRIEDRTGMQPIPVWRPSRGIDYWHKMIEQYPYIAISASGAYDSAWTRKKQAIPVLQKMIRLAHDKNVLVHGLGFTDRKKIEIVDFDSIDSTTWIASGKFGYLYKCTINGMTRTRPTKAPDIKIKLGSALAVHNFNEWVNFQRYAKHNL